MAMTVGITAAAICVPPRVRSAKELFREEGVASGNISENTLGIEEVRLCEKETGSGLALLAARKALETAGLTGSDVQIIVDYSILPQEFLVPAWNMGNKLQHELGASGAFTVGFSGGGATNFLVALSSAAAMLQSGENLKVALLVGADVTIPGNRVLHPDDPVTVMGDGASAVVLQSGTNRSVVVDTELWSDGANHDICYIPGGALAHPERPELYRMMLDKPRYDKTPKFEILAQLATALLKRNGLHDGDVKLLVYTNISQADQVEMQKALGLKGEQMLFSTKETHGHMQGSDLVLNYQSAMESGKLREGEHLLIASHGMGFLEGVSLLRV
jgi:3-oxoacyl-[acyl-carrier-protein] synthase III